MTKKTDRQAELALLHDCLRTMDLPGHKKNPTTNESLRWLARNLGQRNAGHRRYADACGCLERLGWPTSST